MTTEQRKEPKLKLVKWYDAGFPPIDLNANVSAVTELIREVKRLEEIIKAVDLMVYEIGSNGNMGYYEALEHYNKLKSKLPSGI